MKKQGIHTVEHYLDDFILLGPPGTNRCQRNLDRALTICASLGVPLATEKLVGPTTRLTFLGIEIDSLALELRLPTAKLEALRETISAWQGKKCCSKRDMLSLIGQLSHACKVVRPGRRFLRRLINLSSKAKKSIENYTAERRLSGGIVLVGNIPTTMEWGVAALGSSKTNTRSPAME